MKPRSIQRQLALLAPLALTLTLTLQAATVTKATTGTDLTAGASWGGSVPSGTDTATWTGASLGAGLTLGTSAAWQGIAVTGAASSIAITGSGPLTLGAGGIELTGSAVDLSMANGIVLAASQSWKAGAGRTLTVSGAVGGTGDLTSGSAGGSPPVTYNAGYLSTASGSPTTVFTNTSLASITAASGIMNGGWLTAPAAATGYFFTNNGSTATYQLQFYDGSSYTKVAKVQLSQVGADVVAYQVYAAYKSGNVLGQNFDVIAVDGNPPTGSGGYGVSSTTVNFGAAATGTVSLVGNNSYTGATNVNGGTLAVSGGNAIPDASTVSLSSGTTLLLNANETIGSLAGAGAGNLQGNTLTTGGNNTSTTYSGALSGSGGVLVKSGSGTLTLTGVNAQTGATLISQGAIVFNGNSALGSAATVAINDANTGSNNTSLLLQGNAVSTSRAITVTNNGSGTVTLGSTAASSGYLAFSNTLTLNRATTLTSATADRTDYSGKITGPVGTLTITGGQRTTFGSSTNDFVGDISLTGSGTVLQTGAGDPGVERIPNASSVAVGAGTFLKLAGTGSYTETINGLSGSGTVRQHEGVAGMLSLVIGSAGGGGDFSGLLENGGSGTVALTKTGAGTQTLSGTDTYTGATNINGGTLSLGSSGSIAGSASIAVASGAVFDVSSLPSGFTLGGGKTLKGKGTVNGNVAVGVAGMGSLAPGDGVSGALAITGNLTFNGYATVNFGPLASYTAAPALAVTGLIDTTSAAPGDVSINLPTEPVLAGTYHLIGHAGTLADIDAFVLNTEPLLSSRQVGNLVNHAGSIDYVVSGANPTWTGALGSQWTSTTLAAPKNWTLPGGGATDFINGDAVLFNDDATGSTTLNPTEDVSPVAVEFTNNSKNYTLQASGFGITGTCVVVKSGSGVLTITNANSYTGGTTLNAGTIQVGNDAALAADALTLNGGTLASDSTTAHTLTNSPVVIGGDVTLGDALNTGKLAFTSGVGLAAGTRQITTLSAAEIAGSVTNGALTKAGAGTLTLAGNNSYGATTINAGVLQIGNGSTSGSLGSGNITNQAALVVDRSGSLAIGGVISGAGSLTLMGGATLTLSGANNYTGTTTVNASTLVLGMGTDYSVSHVGSAVTINSGGTLRVTQSHATGFAYSIAGNKTPANITINAAGTFDHNGYDTYIENLAMAGNATVTGSGGLRVCANLAATSDATGAPVINTMALVGGNYTDAGNTHTLTVTHGAGSAATSDLTVGIINEVSQSGATNLVKGGNGTLTLTGASNYSGTTTVNAGTLELDGSLTSATTVKTTATLTGTGAGTGTLSVEAGAKVAPGHGIGTLAVGATTLAGTYVCEVGATSSDVLAATGNLNITGSTLDLSGTPAAASYTIATYTGALTGTFTASPALPSGYSLDYATPGQIKLVATAGFTSWINGFTFAPGADKSPTGDPDGDGVSNLMEYALAGRNPTLPDGATGTFNGNLLSFAKRSEAAADAKISYAIQSSDDLGITQAWTEVGSYTSNDATTISFTLPAGKTKTFARLVVTEVP